LVSYSLRIAVASLKKVRRIDSPEARNNKKQLNLCNMVSLLNNREITDRQKSLKVFASFG